MGSSLCERTSLPSPSFKSMSDSYFRDEPKKISVQPIKKRREKHSNFDKLEENNKSSVRESLEKFLADSEDEDFLFLEASHARPNNDKYGGNDESGYSDQLGKIIFDRDLSIAAERVDSKKQRSKHGNNLLKKSSTHARTKCKRNAGRDDRFREGRRGSLCTPEKTNKSSTKHILDGESEGAVSPSTSKSKKRGSKLRGSPRSVTSPRVPKRTQQLYEDHSSPARCRNRSEFDGKTVSDTSKRDKSRLFFGLDDIDRRVRRDRIKNEYRRPHIDPRRHQNRRGHSWDGGGSVGSNMTSRSTLTVQSTRSYKRSGLEGGGLNALMGDEHIARRASRGGGIVALSGSASVASAPADVNFLKERKIRQDYILDVAVREKWLYEDKAEGEVKRVERERVEAGHHFSDGETGEKKRVLAKKLERAARKTAKISKSSAKGAANAIMSPKRTARRAGKAVNRVGKETVKMVKDTKKVMGDTMRGASRVDEKTHGDYDPRLLSDRETYRKSFAERMSSQYGEDIKARNRYKRRSGGGSSEMQHKALNLIDASSKPTPGWWDI